MPTLRKTLLAIAIAASAIPAAFADNVVSGEIGPATHPATSSLAREQVSNDYIAFRAHPVLSDGAVLVQGELGAVSAVQGSSVDRIPAKAHSHVLGNAGVPQSRATAPLSEAERRSIREQYLN